MCYLTSARKTGQVAEKPSVETPRADALLDVIPAHFTGANLIQRQSLGAQQQCKTLFRYERIPGRAESFEIGPDAARIMELVDGKRTVREIASLLKETAPAQSVEETTRAFARYFHHGFLSWRDNSQQA
jgi:hypothetical protein